MQKSFEELIDGIFKRREKNASITEAIRQLTLLYSSEIVRQRRIRSPYKAMVLSYYLMLLALDCLFLSYEYNQGERVPLPVKLFAELVADKSLIGEYLHDVPSQVRTVIGHLAGSAQKALKQEGIQADDDALVFLAGESFFAGELEREVDHFTRLWNERKLSKAKRFEQQFAPAPN